MRGSIRQNPPRTPENLIMTDVNHNGWTMTAPIAEYLMSDSVTDGKSLYRGVLTPVRFDASDREIATLTTGAAVHDLGWLRRIDVRGEDRFRWLSGMVTNTVNDLASDTGAWNLVLNAQGRIQGDLTVWRSSDDLEIQVAADQYDRLSAHLDRFIIMDDVELVPHHFKSQRAIGLTGPQAYSVLQEVGLPAPPEPMVQERALWNGTEVLVQRDFGTLADHYAIWAPVEQEAALIDALLAAGARPVGSAALEAFRIAEGIPAYGIDIAERDLPQETSQMRALHFNKGCYLGQEIVERIRSRGNVHRHLRALELEGSLPAVGTELTLDVNPAGNITSATELNLNGARRVFALGMVRSEAEAHNQPLAYKAGDIPGQARVLAGPPSL